MWGAGHKWFSGSNQRRSPPSCLKNTCCSRIMTLINEPNPIPHLVKPYLAALSLSRSFFVSLQKIPNEQYILMEIATRNDCLWCLQSIILVFPLTEVALTLVTLDVKQTQYTGVWRITYWLHKIGKFHLFMLSGKKGQSGHLRPELFWFFCLIKLKVECHWAKELKGKWEIQCALL